MKSPNWPFGHKFFVCQNGEFSVFTFCGTETSLLRGQKINILFLLILILFIIIFLFLSTHHQKTTKNGIWPTKQWQRSCCLSVWLPWSPAHSQLTISHLIDEYWWYLLYGRHCKVLYRCNHVKEGFDFCNVTLTRNPLLS